MSTGTRPVVVKVGGSTLGEADTTAADLAALQREGVPVVVVHGGGKVINRWLDLHGIESRFVRGLRVTDQAALDVVVAVLAGLVNTALVAEIAAAGGRAAGLAGPDGGTVLAEQMDPELGRVGRVTAVRTELLEALLAAGVMPVLAPIGLDADGGLLNINADTVAGEVARALAAASLVFLTDVPGVLDGDRAPLPRVTREEVARLSAAGVIAGGMMPKVEACLRAAEAGATARIVDGRQAHALLDAVLPGRAGRPAGTVVG
ncbi:MAG TPA: acetylglutamate kinase [Dehalococcoidia bacterium]